MNFLAPWFLAGAVLVAAPIVFHLIRRATRQRIPFSAVRLLTESRPRLDSRSRVQHPWLLLLRCLILAILAIAFARPYWSEQDASPAATTGLRQRVIILDDSASMRRPGVWEQARARVLTAVGDLAPGDQLVLLTAGQRVEERIGLEAWLGTAPSDRAAAVRAVLNAHQPGWGAFALDAAVEAARVQWERMAEHTPGARAVELMIVSDFASGSRISGLAGLAWPETAAVHLLPVTPSSHGNASAHWLGWSEAEDGARLARMRVSRDLESAGPLHWTLYPTDDDTPLQPARSLDLLPGTAQTIVFPWPVEQRTLRFQVEGDRADFDNHVWIAAPTPRTLVVSYLGQSQPEDPARASYFISRALQGWEGVHVEMRPTLDGSAAPTLIVIDQPLNAAAVLSVRTLVAAGASALVLLGGDDVAERARTAAELAGEQDWNALPPRAPALLGTVDFQHPLFAPFADPRFSDFTRIRFWLPHSVALPPDSGARVIARFDDDAPALVECPVGAGRVIVWGGDWAPKASQWVLSSKFVPWLHALIERASGGPPQATVLELGESIAPADQRTPGVFASPERPDEPIAINVPASESNLEPLALDVWEQLGVPLARGDAAASHPSAPVPVAAEQVAALEREQQAWRWLAWAALLMLAFESLVSGYLTRRESAVDPARTRPAPAIP